MLASEPPLERNASEWLVGSPTFQALNVYDPHDFGERFSARGSQREMKPPVCRHLAGLLEHPANDSLNAISHLLAIWQVWQVFSRWERAAENYSWTASASWR